jgi:RHS repeat-associated protein
MPAYSGGVGQNATGGALDPRFDVEQRFRGGGDSPGFGYDPWGHRIFSQIGTASGELWFYGGDGRKLDTYQWAIDSNNVLYATEHGITRYMAGKLMEDNGVFMASDRLGSVRAISTSNALISYFPWGEERPQPNGTTTPDGMVKFGGYYRDHPGQNYAGARYYNEGGGYFTSPDPGGMATADSSDPNSWNRGSYVGGDPIDFVDPEGLFKCNPEVPGCTSKGTPRQPFCDLHPNMPTCQPGGHTAKPTGPKPPTPPPSGGGGYSGSGLTNAGLLPAALLNAYTALNHGDCAGIFGSPPANQPNLPPTAEGELTSLIINSDIAFQKITSGAVATTEVSDGQPTVTINTVIPGPGYANYWNQGSAYWNGVTILHELGHVLADLGWTGDQILDDSDSADLSRSNTNVIIANCAKYFRTQ